MTTFAELQSLVTEQTKRPDLAAITQQCIRMAVLRAHSTDFFPRDLAEDTVTYTPSGTGLNTVADIYTALPRLRSMKTIYGMDAGKAVEQFEYRDPDDMHDTATGALRASAFTVVGTTLRFNTLRETGTLLAQFYRNPIVTSTGFSSWIADEYPDDIALWAAASVHARVGYDTEAERLIRTAVQPFQRLLVQTYVIGVAR